MGPLAFAAARSAVRQRPARRSGCARQWPVIESAATVSENIETPADGGCLERAIAAGDLDTCRTELGRNALSSEERAGLYCRLGEAFYYRGQYADAVDCARVAFDLQPDVEAVADRCAWLFSNCGQHHEAALTYERLLERRRGWAAGHRHASGSFAVAGDFDRAI